DRCPCFGSLFPPLAALTFAASSIICAFGLASAAPRSPYRHLELCGIAFNKKRAAAPHCKPQHPEHKIGGKHDLYPLQLPRAGRKNGACNYRYRPLQRSGRSVCCCAGTVEPQV
ncbi:hypothetical protein, partial [Gemmiger qucibialis]|uniref:hypothetical protein n=1 Tax=Gemmiger qucibialis TaxID=2997294 RepID=UPI0022DEBC88